MKLKDEEPLTWVSYKGNPYFICYTADDLTSLWINRDEILVNVDCEIDIIEVPRFNIGDSVLYIGTFKDYQNQIVTITDLNSSTYRPYQINNRINATPFDLVPLNY